jgi:hypothetical protein
MNTTALIVALALNASFCDRALHQNSLRSADYLVDRALALDGRDDFVTVPASEALRYPGEGGWTLELWVKPVIYPHHNVVTIVGQESVGVDARDAWSLRAHTTHFEFRVDDDHGGADAIRFDMALGIWQHVACVYENTEVQGRHERWLSVYINGVLIERRKTDIEMASRHDPVYMGALGKARFRGLLDDVRVWSHAFEKDELKALRSGRIDVADVRLRGCWTFDETDGSVAIDSSKYGAHAVLGHAHDPHDHSDPARVVRAISR